MSLQDEDFTLLPLSSGLKLALIYLYLWHIYRYKRYFSMTAEFEDQKVSPQYDPKRVEQLIIDFWKTNNTFEKSITSKAEDQPYRFYDGPPFIT